MNALIECPPPTKLKGWTATQYPVATHELMSSLFYWGSTAWMMYCHNAAPLHRATKLLIQCRAAKLTAIVKPNSMDDKLTRHGTTALCQGTASLWYSPLSSWQAVDESLAVCLKLWPDCLRNVLGDTATATKLVIAWVDNGCDLLLGQVTLHHLQ